MNTLTNTSTSVAVIITIIFFLVNRAQSSTDGSDFYIGSMRNNQGITTSYSLYLSTLCASPVIYAVKNIYNYTIATGTVSTFSPTIQIINIAYVTNSNSERNDGIHLSSTGPISVLVVNWQSYSVGEYLAYPKQVFPVYQYEYYTASPNTELSSTDLSEVLLVGTEDGTTVTISPAANVSVPTDIQTPGSPEETLSAGQTKVITLNRLQTFFFGSSGLAVDMTGTSIVSDKPLTVISGHECANVPANKDYCEHVEEQIPPTVTWGKKHLVCSYTGKEDYSYLLIVSSEDNTTVKHNCGGTMTTLSFASAGDHSTISLYTDNNCYIESNRRILITQMMTGSQDTDLGDPAVSALPPIEHYTNKVVFHSPTFGQGLNYNYINIVAQTKDTIMMDGQALAVEWESISDFYGGTAGYSATLPVSVDVHNIYSVNGVPFYVLVYGYSSDFTGYSFSAGFGILFRDNVTEECSKPPTEPPTTTYTSWLTTSILSISRPRLLTTSSDATPTSSSGDNSLGVTLTAAGVGAGVVITIMIVIVLLIIVTIVVFYKMRSTAMKYQIEEEMESNITMKVNSIYDNGNGKNLSPTYEEMDNGNTEHVYEELCGVFQS